MFNCMHHLAPVLHHNHGKLSHYLCICTELDLFFSFSRFVCLRQCKIFSFYSRIDFACWYPFTGFMWHVPLTTAGKTPGCMDKQLFNKAKLIASLIFSFDMAQMGVYTKGLFTIISFQQLALEQHENTINTKVCHNSDSQQMKFTIHIFNLRNRVAPDSAYKNQKCFVFVKRPGLVEQNDLLVYHQLSLIFECLNIKTDNSHI